MYHLVIYKNKSVTELGVYIIQERKSDYDDSYVFGPIVRIIRSHQDQEGFHNAIRLELNKYWNFYRTRIKASSEDIKELEEIAYLELL